jgi:hypothetical protein
MSLHVTRRGFLTTLAAGILGAAIGVRLYWTKVRAPTEAGQLARLLPHADSAARLGRRYLEDTPQEADATRLVALMGTTLAAGESDAALRERLETRIHQDFIEGATVSVDGWLLSVTEARLCALVHLMHGAHPA